MTANDTETRFFLTALEEVTGIDLVTNNMMNYEPNYVYSLMRSHPIILYRSVIRFDTDSGLNTDIIQPSVAE